MCHSGQGGGPTGGRSSYSMAGSTLMSHGGSHSVACKPHMPLQVRNVSDRLASNLSRAESIKIPTATMVSLANGIVIPQEAALIGLPNGHCGHQ